MVDNTYDFFKDIFLRSEPEGSYIAFHHVKLLLNHDQWLHSKIPAIQAALGVKSRNRIEKLINGWLELSDKMPLAFLEAMDLNADLVKKAFEFDYQAYQFACKRPLRISQVRFRAIACVYPTITPPFPPEQIDTILAWVTERSRMSRDGGMQHWVTFDPPVKSAFAKGGTLSVAALEPKMVVTEGHVQFLLGESPAGISVLPQVSIK